MIGTEKEEQSEFGVHPPVYLEPFEAVEIEHGEAKNPSEDNGRIADDFVHPPLHEVELFGKDVLLGLRPVKCFDVVNKHADEVKHTGEPSHEPDDVQCFEEEKIVFHMI